MFEKVPPCLPLYHHTTGMHHTWAACQLAMPPPLCAHLVLLCPLLTLPPLLCPAAGTALVRGPRPPSVARCASLSTLHSTTRPPPCARTARAATCHAHCTAFIPPGRPSSPAAPYIPRCLPFARSTRFVVVPSCAASLIQASSQPTCFSVYTPRGLRPPNLLVCTPSIFLPGSGFLFLATHVSL